MTTPSTSLGNGTQTPIRAFLDSGAPEGSTDYTTVVIIHGWGWHSGSFKRLIPFAKPHNARVVLVNRRDYPGSDPYTPEELATPARLATTPDVSPETAAEAEAFMRDRAREVFDFLTDFVRRERIPRARENTGGIVVVGWSLGSLWITALLANVRLFPEGDVKLSEYVLGVVLYDTSFLCYGYAPPPDAYQPLYETSVTFPERVARFNVWVTGYYAHGDVWAKGADALEYRNALSDPSPTITRMTPEDLAETTYGPPQEEGGSEGLIILACVGHGTGARLKEDAFYPREPVEGASNWSHVEVRQVWCDRSVWEMPWCVKLLTEELEEARRAGKNPRDIVFVRFEGANHFAHWDLPEKTLDVFLGVSKRTSRTQ
ncbi:alpha/beta-hydrolase [Pilatotrama ljubarskyi]|nr:alpha/beta-hydrolase [Pilatotrama ljubarskyi]